MSYSLGWTKGTVAKKDFDCLCCVCRKPLVKGDTITQNEVHKCGELQYFELAHVDCVKEAGNLSG